MKRTLSASRDDIALPIAFAALALCAGTAVLAESYGSLLVPGPAAGPQTFLEVQTFDLLTRVQGTMPPGPSGQFSERPAGLTSCPDGSIYVSLLSNGGVFKIDPVTWSILDTLPIPTGPASTGLGCLPNGNLLVWDDDYVGTIKEYDPDGVFLGDWVTGLGLIRHIQMTPVGTVAFLDGHPANTNNRLVEYDVTGTYIRDIIPSSTASRGMYSFEFASDTEMLVLHYPLNCIKRWDWTTSTATYLDDFVCDTAKVNSGAIAINASDGAVFQADNQNACIWGWEADGTPLYDGDALHCYGASPLYAGPIMVLPDDLRASYPFDEGAGAFAHDATGAFDGTLQGSAAWCDSAEAREGGSCVLFDHPGDAVSLPAGAINDMGQGTFMCWVYPTARTSLDPPSHGLSFVVSKIIPNTRSLFTVFLEHDGTVRTNIGGADSFPGTSCVAPLNAWTHIAITWDGTTKNVYMNGVLDSSGGAATVENNLRSIFVGFDETTPEARFIGRIDEIRILDKALTAVEVAATIDPFADCNSNGVPDQCDMAVGSSQDCNDSGIPDECELAAGTSFDCNTNGIPDECEPDFDGDGLIDECDPDIDEDGVANELDACDFTPIGAAIITDPANYFYGTLPADLDGDCDVDLEDYAVLAASITGPNGL